MKADFTSLSSEVRELVCLTPLPDIGGDVREALLTLALIEIRSHEAPLDPVSVNRFNEVRGALQRIGISARATNAAHLEAPICGRITNLAKLVEANPTLFRHKDNLLDRLI